MPVEFLSDEQVGAYGRFSGELSVAEVERFIYLDDADRDLIACRRSDHHRLGFAAQLGTVRAVGRFLEDPLDVPWPAVEYLAEQLEIGDASCVKKYAQRPQTPYEHAWEIRDRYGYRSWAGQLAVLGVGRAKVSDIPANRLQVLARTGLGSKASALARLEKASKTVARAGRVLLDQLTAAEDSGIRLDVAALWTAVERVAPRAAVVDAIDLVEELVPDDDGAADSAMRAALAGRYNTVRPFLTLLGESAALRAAPGGERVLAAVRALPELARRRVTQKPLTGEEIDAEPEQATQRPSTEIGGGATSGDTPGSKSRCC